MNINELSTVNSGEIVKFNVQDIFIKNKQLELEILRPEKHNKNMEITCYYFWDNKQKIKVEVTLYRSKDKKQYGSEVYYFKSKNSIQHYRSRHYINFVGMPKKYYDIIKYIHPYFLSIYGN